MNSRITPWAGALVVAISGSTFQTIAYADDYPYADTGWATTHATRANQDFVDVIPAQKYQRRWGARELEHAAAILHPKLGAPLRKAVEKGAALVPSSKKMGGPGTPLDVPLGHKDAAYVRSHFDGMEVRINDAPRANEILVAVCVTDSGRPLPRVGGLTHEEAEGKDGLR